MRKTPISNKHGKGPSFWGVHLQNTFELLGTTAKTVTVAYALMASFRYSSGPFFTNRMSDVSF